MPGYGDAWGDAPYGDPRITQPSVLSYGAATGSGTSRTTASFSVAANRVIVFCCSSTSGSSFPESPPVLTGMALSWTYQTKGHENGTFPRQAWMWSAFTGPIPPASGTITWTTTNAMSGNAHYSVIQFEEGEVDLTDPIVQPRGDFPDLPPDNGGQVFDLTHEMATLADERNGILQYALLGAANPASIVTLAPGFDRLAFQQSGSSWGSETQWSDNGDTLVIQNDWPAASGGLISHWVSVACEIRAAGTDNTVGRIRDRSLTNGASTTDGTVFTTASITTFRERDVWLAVTSARTAATPGTPVITDTAGFSWSLADSTAYSTIASPAQKLWLFHARTGTSDPGANTVTITYPQTQTACAWQISETWNTNGASARVQAKTNRIDSSGAAGFTTTLDAPCDPTSSVMFFMAKNTYDHTAGDDVLTGTVEAGWVQHEQSTVTSPGLSISAFGRHTPDDTASINLWTNGDAAMIFIEFAFSGATSVTTIDADPISVTPTLFAPRVNESVLPDIISVVPQLFTPQPSTTSFAQTIRFSTGAFQQSAFDDVAFDYGTPVFADMSPTLYAPTTGTVSDLFVYTPAPGDTIAAFQQDAFDDETFQQFAAGSGISHTPSLNAPSVAATVAAEQFVYLTGTGGWDSTLFVWDDPNHDWDEGNIGGIVQQSPQLFTPVVTGKVTVPLLDATPELFVHSVAPKSITVPLISHPPALFDHKVNMLVFQADIIDVPVVLFGFFIQAPVTPDLIDHTPELFTPTVNPQQVETPLIVHEPAVFDQRVNMSVLPDLLDATPTLYAPTVGPVITPDCIDATPEVFLPSLERIFVDLIDIGVELFEPQKVNIPTNTVVNFEFIALAEHEPELFEPVSIELSPPQFVIGQFIDGTPLVMGPHVITTTRPTIILRARYDPVTGLHARYDPVTLKHAQNSRQGS